MLGAQVLLAKGLDPDLRRSKTGSGWLGHLQVAAVLQDIGGLACLAVRGIAVGLDSHLGTVDRRGEDGRSIADVVAHRVALGQGELAPGVLAVDGGEALLGAGRALGVSTEVLQAKASDETRLIHRVGHADLDVLIGVAAAHGRGRRSASSEHCQCRGSRRKNRPTLHLMLP